MSEITTAIKYATCPRCGMRKLVANDEANNALSRRYVDTYVCSDCGQQEAFEDFGISDPKPFRYPPKRGYIKPPKYGIK